MWGGLALGPADFLVRRSHRPRLVVWFFLSQDCQAMAEGKARVGRETVARAGSIVDMRR